MIVGRLHICVMCYSLTRSVRQMVLSHCTDMYLFHTQTNFPCTFQMCSYH